MNTAVNVRSSLRAALEAAEQLGDMRRRDSALFAVAVEMALVEPMEALKLVPRLEDPWGRAFVLRRIVRAISPGDNGPLSRDRSICAIPLPVGVG